jgi:hypothetical protein
MSAHRSARKNSLFWPYQTLIVRTASRLEYPQVVSLCVRTVNADLGSSPCVCAKRNAEYKIVEVKGLIVLLLVLSYMCLRGAQLLT